ncbi:DNA mismatch endonuclease Vsr [Pandoraea sputorum]|uniref:DNA mismatch endonuclease Vsr n=1 Tax=Pandoraea sputorum TaxID=93222 RepID=UPI001256015B|nr:DNA mismatch endonuclease Vsr [Pandoraea sputorum]VVE80350.1 HNH endonuclease [Pandoraea sputorum]
MADVLTPEQRKRCMSRVKNRNTDIELTFRKGLWSAGLRYRLNVKLPGKPDIAFTGHKLAVFVDGCYWHGCPEHGQIPKTNAQFWREKINKNVARDSTVTTILEANGWRVLRFWQHELKRNLAECVARVQASIKQIDDRKNMVRRSQQKDPESLRKELIVLLTNFEAELKRDDLRGKVIALVPAHHGLRDLGSSLILDESAPSARDRILLYLTKYPRQMIAGDELMVISGIGEWARRVRELRVEHGWSIASGVAIKEMLEQGELKLADLGVSKLDTNDYMLLDEQQDRDAAFRWNTANVIRKTKASVQDKILEFLKANVGKPVTGEELRYVANDKTEWARRVRELRTEEGWAVATRNMGRPELPIGTYILEDLHQAPPHDRRIPDDVRRTVLRRDGYKCLHCGWTPSEWNKADPRHLELHHKVQHAHGGKNDEENLITLCTVCHDVVHRDEKV